MRTEAYTSVIKKSSSVCVNKTLLRESLDYTGLLTGWIARVKFEVCLLSWNWLVCLKIKKKKKEKVDQRGLSAYFTEAVM